jgi:DNA-binding transcriptional regulator YhcF (GntR family)
MQTPDMRALPVIEIDPASPLPAYRQIADALRLHLVAGRLRAGEQLPTVRALAMELGLNHNTVAEAYRILAEEGWLDLGRSRGATVVHRAGPGPSAEATGRFARRLREILAEALAAGVPAQQVERQLATAVREVADLRRRS